MTIDIERLEYELKQRLTEPFQPWGRKQSDNWDRKTDFIYQTPTFNGLKNKIFRMDSDLYKYAINRWFNFWSAAGIETIICQLPGVTAARKKDKLKDFSIAGISFDHKTTVFPRGYSHGYLYAKAHPDHLAEWLYQNQSTESRYHLSNRLFIALYAQTGEHWKLRAELTGIKTTIQNYVESFDAKKLIQLKLNDHLTLTDVIWFEQ